MTMEATATENRPMCHCPRCGRSHWKLGTPPAALTHDDVCRLSRAFNMVAAINDAQDYRINEWLKVRIAEARLDGEITKPSKPKPYSSGCLASDIPGATCQSPNCDC